jgi:two-component system sensor histidine kinase YesM
VRLLRKVTYRAQLILLIITFAFFIGLTDLYYMSEFSRVVKDRESAYMQSVIDDTDNWLDQMSLGFRNAATEIKNNATVQNYMSTKTSRAKASYRVSLYETMRLVCASSPFINGMLLLDPDGTISSMNLVAPIIVLEALSEQYDLKALEADVLTPMMQVPNAFNGTPFACYISPVIGAENPSLRSACIFVFQMHDRQFNNYITGSSLTENSQFYLLDSLNKIVYSRLPVDDLGKAESDIASIISSNLDNGSEMVLQNARSLVFTGVNDQLGWRSVSIVPVQEINMELRVIQRIAFAIGIGSFVIFVAIGLIFIWNMSRPLSLLLTNLRYMGETNLSKRLPVLYENEIGVITREINGMMDKIQNMTETSFAMRNKMYESELNLKNAELRALQSQINPHFLYNTLECIRSIALVEGIPSIATISESMAGIFRYSISGGLLSTVEREVECARSYIEIISIRFGGRIAFSFHIDPEVLNEPMVKITLQPIVENAVQHGLSEVEEGGVVDVSGYIQDDFIIFTVSDNGAGMDAQIVERLNESFIQRENKGMLMPDESNHTSIGLANINSRIRAYYGEPYGIHVESSPGNGTAVTLRMPMNAGL